MIQICDDSAESPQADVAGAGAIADDVTPATDFSGASIGGAAKATGSGAAQHQDSSVRHFRQGHGCESGLEIVGCDAWNLWPDPRSGTAQALGVGFGPHTGESNADGRGCAGETFGDIAEVPLQLPVRDQRKHGGTRRKLGQNRTVFSLQAHGGPGATSFDTQVDERR